MMRWMAVAVSVIVIATGGATAIYALADDTSTAHSARRTDGPLKVPRPHGGAVTLATGATFTDGFEILSLAGERDAVIDSISLVDSAGFELLGAEVASPDRKTGFVQFVHGWPPVAKELRGTELVPATGATITPTGSSDGAGWELFVGIRVTGDGLLTRTGLKIDYTVDGEKFTATFPAELVVCTDSSYEVNGNCPLGG